MRKLATAGFSFAFAILLSRYLIPYNLLVICAAIAAAISLTGLLLRGYRRMRVLIAFLSLSAGFLWNWGFTSIYTAPLDAYHDQTLTVRAVVRDYPSPTVRGSRADVVITPYSGGGIGARLYFYDDTELTPGEIIEFKARFAATYGAENSERIDALSSRGAFLAGYVSGGITSIGTEEHPRYLPQRITAAVADMIGRVFDEDVSPFMQALLVGKRDALAANAELETALSASGISHVVAISGMHVSFLMGFIASVVKNKRLFAIIGIPVLFLFMAMTGFTPSVSRAGVMQIFLICAPLFKRESDSLTSLSLALLLLLIINPFAIGSVGLQLSFTATLGIILFTGKISAALTDGLRDSGRIKNKAFKTVLVFIISGAATTIGAIVFTVPLTAIHFGAVSLAAPLTNLLVLWAVSLAFPLGILACIVGFVYLPLGAWIAFPVGYAVRYIIFVARNVAALPYSSVYSTNAHVIYWLAYIYIMFFVLPLLRARLRQYLLPACLSVVLLCTVLVLSSGLPQASRDGTTVLDVGQGLSAVISRQDKTAVVDCGSGSGEDAGAIAHEFLANRGVTSIDLLILTHFHSDHANGVEYLLARTDIAALVIPPPDDSVLAESILTLARNRGTDIIYVTETLRVSLGADELVIYPAVGFGDENEEGLSVLSLGDNILLITGDMASQGERALLRFADIPDIDTLVVGHHGSRFSTSEELLRAVTPETAIISVGYNTYGHPADATLDRLGQYSIEVFRTDIMGNITVAGSNQ